MNKSSLCPICGRAAERGFTPFCSKRCADVDLGRWFSGDYRVPGPPADDDESDSSIAGPSEEKME
ncbi:DNA gyrase inhibitor YacG [Acetobacter sacchari]|uniref:DNA gyrase inhibitor YacG n=1 Tax=Acetobacter sacchari TaxID=2661687 RepID=A0ABS3LZP5_9PROT|nr:DNA gyrase inhibitor YacG [Acetobacter sacchari]MBO1361387.1 DNA gyrase inhibitor YacG [Acetobacter sacchari]